MYQTKTNKNATINLLLHSKNYQEMDDFLAGPENERDEDKYKITK